MNLGDKPVYLIRCRNMIVIYSIAAKVLLDFWRQSSALYLTSRTPRIANYIYRGILKPWLTLNVMKEEW